MLPNGHAGGGATIWTIGHSTRSIEEFLSLLAAHGVQVLVDVRSHPGSRKFPHFNREGLEAAVRGAGVRYVWMPELGGRRRPRKDSPNTRWRNESFRGYADYMATPEFSAGLRRLLEIAVEGRTAIMCSEAVWWRCHRGLIADALKAAGNIVLHIEGTGEAAEHPYTSAARIVEGGRLSYAGDERGLFGGGG